MGFAKDFVWGAATSSYQIEELAEIPEKDRISGMFLQKSREEYMKAILEI